MSSLFKLFNNLVKKIKVCSLSQLIFNYLKRVIKENHRLQFLV